MLKLDAANPVIMGLENSARIPGFRVLELKCLIIHKILWVY